MYPPNATASFANNGFEHSISDKRIGGQTTTPVSKNEPSRQNTDASLTREKSHRDNSRSNSHNADGKPSAEGKTSEDHPTEAGQVQKGKNPYYFTFFNEKNSDGEKRERPAEDPPKDAPDAFTLNYSTIDQVDVARRPTM